MKKPSDIAEELRAGIDMSDQQAAQLVYEKWLKLEQWRAREVALPLIIGCDPDLWQDYLSQYKLAATEELFWHILSNDLSIATDDSVSIATVTEWARVQTTNLHPSFLRIYGFVRKVMIASTMPDSVADSPKDNGSAEFGNQLSSEQRAKIALAQEREIVLGAALSLLAKMPDKCRDTNGFADGAAIVTLIEQTAAKWFPSGSSALSKTAMTTLIDQWLE